MNVEPLTMQKNKQTHTPRDEQVLKNPTELDRGQFIPKLLFIYLFIFI